MVFNGIITYILYRKGEYMELLPVEADELESIKIRTTGYVLSKFNKFKSSMGENLNASMDDLLFVMGVKSGKFSRVMVEKALAYNDLPEEEKLITLNSQDDVDNFKEIIEYRNQKIEKLFQAPMDIFNIMVDKGIVDDKPVGSFDDFLDVLSFASGISKERLFISDMYIWIEMFVRLWLKNKGEIGSSFFILKAVHKLMERIPSLNSIAKKAQSITSNM